MCICAHVYLAGVEWLNIGLAQLEEEEDVLDDEPDDLDEEEELWPVLELLLGGCLKSCLTGGPLISSLAWLKIWVLSQ